MIDLVKLQRQSIRNFLCTANRSQIMSELHISLQDKDLVRARMIQDFLAECDTQNAIER